MLCISNKLLFNSINTLLRACERIFMALEYPFKRCEYMFAMPTNILLSTESQLNDNSAMLKMR